MQAMSHRAGVADTSVPVPLAGLRSTNVRQIARRPLLLCRKPAGRRATGCQSRFTVRASTQDELKKATSKVGEAASAVADAASSATAKATAVLQDLVDENVLDYCSLDSKGKRPIGKLSLGEKEQLFLDALRAFYYDEKSELSNEEFDNLKEELLWEGSKVAILSTTEQTFMEASLAYAAGKPILSDGEYDELKRSLRKQNSRVVAQGPRCSLRSRSLYSDCSPDYLKMTLLNVPATLLTLLALFSVDDITGFEITRLLELPEPYGIIVVWGLCLPLLFVFATTLTNIVLKDALILAGPCPNCGAENNTYFGDILTVSGNRDKNTVQCGSCKAQLQFDSNARTIKVEKLPGADDGAKSGGPKRQSGGPAKKPATA